MSGRPQPVAAVVLRPSLRRYLRTVRLAVLPVGVLLAALLVRGGAFGAIVSITFIALGSSVIPVYFRRAAITVTADEIVVTGLIRTRRTPRSAAASIVTAALPRSHKASKSVAHLYLLDGDGRRIARMKSSSWVEDDMLTLIRLLAIQPRKLGRLASARVLAKAYPHAVPLLERWPVLANALMVLPILAAIAAVSWASTD